MPAAAKTGSSKASKSNPTKKDSSKASSKKRVRVVEPEDDAEAGAAEEEAAPVEAEVKETKAKKSKKAKKDEVVELDTSRRDLKDKDPSTLKEIVSAEAPAPGPGLLKNTSSAASLDKVALEEDDEVDDDAEAEGSEEIDFLNGFEDSEEDGGEDSSDEEDDGEATPFKLEELPKVKGSDAAVQKKLEAKAERKKNAKTGTIYLGRIPHGFHEEEMKSYFSQFGEVTRLRLSRNKNTGASKHYAFIEFAYASVAQIVQETMDNYLLAGHILVCKVVPDNEIHPKLWIGANRKFRPIPKGRKDRIRRETPKTSKQKSAIKKRLLKRENEKREKLAALGIEYEFSGFANKEIEGEKEAEKAVETAKKDKSKKKKAAKTSEEPAKKKARKST